MNKILNAKLNEDTNLLKLVALITMLTDHIGLVFFKDIQIFRMIGRLSFPLFAYSTFIGYYKTNNLKKYILRLLIIGIIAEPIYNLLFIKEYFSLNIMFTLSMELVIIHLLENKKYIILPIPIIFMTIFHLEYSFHTLLLIPVFYYLRNNKVFFSIIYSLIFVNYLLDIKTNTYSIINFCGILTLPLFLINTNTNIKINKWFYYIFYPAHLLILYIIKILI